MFRKIRPVKEQVQDTECSMCKPWSDEMPVEWDGYTGLGGCRLPRVTERGVIRNRAMHRQRRCEEREETTVGEY